MRDTIEIERDPLRSKTSLLFLLGSHVNARVARDGELPVEERRRAWLFDFCEAKRSVLGVTQWTPDSAIGHSMRRKTPHAS